MYCGHSLDCSEVIINSLFTPTSAVYLTLPSVENALKLFIVSVIELLSLISDPTSTPD